MSSDTFQLTASTTVNGETVSITIHVPGRLWQQMPEDYILTARTRLATEVIKHLDVETTITRDGDDDE